MKMTKGLFKKIGYGLGGAIIAGAIYFGLIKDDNKKYIETRKHDPEPEEEKEDADFKEA